MSLNRRQFLTAASAVVATSAFDLRQIVAQAAGQAPTPPATAFAVVRGTVGIFTGQGGTIGWHVDSKSVVVIDSQFPATARVCLDGINARSQGRPLDYLINTHHHGDHTGGNAVFRPVARKILAHVKVPTLQKEAADRAAAAVKPGAPAPPAHVSADSTFEQTWREDVGDDVMALKYYGPAHTGGDAVVTFEKANVVHLGDLVFNRRHPFIDRPAGASIANWITVLEHTTRDHGRDTLYIFGHAGPGFEAIGRAADLAFMRDYLTSLLEFVRSAIKAGTPREMVIAGTDPLKGFPDHGPLVERVLAAAYDELAG